MAVSPPQLIGSSIAPTSISQPFGAYGPTYGNSSLAPSSAGGGGSATGGSVAGGIGYLGAAGLAAFSGLGSSSGSNPANAAAVYGIQQGAGNGATGNIGAALSAGSLANSAGAFGTHVNTAGQTVNGNTDVGAGLGIAGGAMGIYNGIQQGGVQGYGGAAVGALRAGSGIASLAGNSALAGGLGAAAGYIAAPLALYSAIANYQSGDTKGDAIRGAEAGAAIGSIVPGVGTLIGGVIGGVVGAASAAFGNGEQDPETGSWNSFVNATNGAHPNPAQVAQMTSTQNMSPQQSFNLLAGIMDVKDGTQPITNAFGQKSEGALLTSMTDQINSAISSGKVPKNATPQQLYSQVVTPWLNSKGATIGPETGGIQLQGVLTNLIGHWQNGSLNSKTDLTSGGSTDSALEAYG